MSAQHQRISEKRYAPTPEPNLSGDEAILPRSDGCENGTMDGRILSATPFIRASEGRL